MSSTLPQHRKRQHSVQALYAYRAGNNRPQTQTSRLVIKNIILVDQAISTAAPRWPLSQINWVDLSILRLASYELLFCRQIPYKVVINEAIELAKDFGDQQSASFVNAVLGTIYQSLPENKEKT